MQEGFAIFGTKDEMDMQPREGLWRGLERPFRALVCFMILSRGIAPGWC